MKETSYKNQAWIMFGLIILQALFWQTGSSLPGLNLVLVWLCLISLLYDDIPIPVVIALMIGGFFQAIILGFNLGVFITGYLAVVVWYRVVELTPLTGNKLFKYLNVFIILGLFNIVTAFLIGLSQTNGLANLYIPWLYILKISTINTILVGLFGYILRFVLKK